MSSKPWLKAGFDLGLMMKMLQALTMLLCVFMFMLQVHQSYAAYSDHDFVQTMSEVRSDKISFPMLVLCDHSPFKIDESTDSDSDSVSGSDSSSAPESLPVPESANVSESSTVPEPLSVPEPGSGPESDPSPLSSFKRGLEFVVGGGPPANQTKFKGWTENPKEYVHNMSSMANITEYKIKVYLKKHLMKDTEHKDRDHTRQLELKPLRVNYEWGLCYTAELGDAMAELYGREEENPVILYVEYSAEKMLKIFLNDRNTDNGYIFRGFSTDLERPNVFFKYFYSIH